jgi:hypothetical protein
MINLFWLQGVSNVFKHLMDTLLLLVFKQDGLTHPKVRPYTDQEFETLPQVMMTSELEWYPSVLDHEFKEDEQWGDTPTIPGFFDNDGDYKHHVALQHQSYFQRQDGNSIDDVIYKCFFFHSYTTFYL